MDRAERAIVLDSVAIERHHRAREVEQLKRRVYLLEKENIELRKNKSPLRDQLVEKLNGQATELATRNAELRELETEAETWRACDEMHRKHDVIGELTALKLEHEKLLSSRNVLLSAHKALEDSQSTRQHELDDANRALAKAVDDARVLEQTYSKKLAEAQDTCDRLESALNEERERGTEASESLSRIRTTNRDLAKQAEEKRIELTQMKRDKKNLQGKLQKNVQQRQEIQLRCDHIVHQRETAIKEHEKNDRRMTGKLELLKAQTRKDQKSVEENTTTQTMLLEKLEAAKHTEHELSMKIDVLSKLIRREKENKSERRAIINHVACQASTNAAVAPRMCDASTETNDEIPLATTPNWSSRSPQSAPDECLMEHEVAPSLVDTPTHTAPSHCAATVGVATKTDDDAACVTGIGTAARTAKALFLQGAIGEEQYADIALADIAMPQGEELVTAWGKVENEIPNIPVLYGDRWPQFLAAKARMGQAVQDVLDGLKNAATAARKWEARCEYKVVEKRAVETQLAATLGELQGTTERLSVRNNEHCILSEQLTQSKWRIVALENKVYKSDLEKQRRCATSGADNKENDEPTEGKSNAGTAVTETIDAELGNAQQNGVLFDDSTAAFYERVRHRAEMRAQREGRPKAVEALRAAKYLDAHLHDQCANAPRAAGDQIPVHTIIATTHDRIVQKQNEARATRENAPDDNCMDDLSGGSPSSVEYLMGDTPSATEDLSGLSPSAVEGDEWNNDDEWSDVTVCCSISGEDGGIGGTVAPTIVSDSMVSTPHMDVAGRDNASLFFSLADGSLLNEPCHIPVGTPAAGIPTAPRMLVSSMMRHVDNESTARIVYSMQRITSQQLRTVQDGDSMGGATPRTQLTALEDMPAARRRDNDDSRSRSQSSRVSKETVTAALWHRSTFDGELPIGVRSPVGGGGKERVFLTQVNANATIGGRSTSSSALQGRSGGDEGTITRREQEDGGRTDRDATLVRSEGCAPCDIGREDVDIPRTIVIRGENGTPDADYRIDLNGGNASTTHKDTNGVKNESSSSSSDAHLTSIAREELRPAEHMKSTSGPCREEMDGGVSKKPPDHSADNRLGVTLSTDPQHSRTTRGAHTQAAPAVRCSPLVVPSSQTPTFVCVRAESPDGRLVILPPTQTTGDAVHASNIPVSGEDDAGKSGTSYAAMRESRSPVEASLGERATTGDAGLEDLLACGYQALVDFPSEEGRRDEERTMSTSERAEHTRHTRPYLLHPLPLPSERSSSSCTSLHLQPATCPDPVAPASSAAVVSAQMPPLAEVAQASGRSSLDSLEELFLRQLEAGSGDEGKTSMAAHIEDSFIARVCS